MDATAFVALAADPNPEGIMGSRSPSPPESQSPAIDPTASIAFAPDPNPDGNLGHRSPSPSESQPPEKKPKIEEEEEEDDDDDSDDDGEEDEETKKLKAYLYNVYLTGDVAAECEAGYATVEIEPHILKNYRDQLEKSEGFDIDYIPGAASWPLISPVLNFHENDDLYCEFAQSAVDHHNQIYKKDGKLELLKILKVNVLAVADPLIFMTLVVQDTADGNKKTYQAKLKLGNDGSEFLIFRERASTSSGDGKLLYKSWETGHQVVSVI